MLSRSCRNAKIVVSASDYKSMFFKLSADIKFMPINLDLVPDCDDFVPPIRQVLYNAFLRFFEEIWPGIRRKHAQRFLLPPNLKRTINFLHFYV